MQAVRQAGVKGKGRVVGATAGAGGPGGRVGSGREELCVFCHLRLGAGSNLGSLGEARRGEASRSAAKRGVGREDVAAVARLGGRRNNGLVRRPEVGEGGRGRKGS